MELCVDGAAKPVPMATSAGELLIALRDELGRSGRVMTVVMVDGSEMLPENEAAIGPRPLSELGRVEITTADAKEWGRHGLGEASSALGQLSDEVRAIADLLRGGDREESVVRFHNAVATYGQLVQAMINAAALAGCSAPSGLQQAVGRVLAAMRSITPVLGADDAVAAADLSEYELAPELEKLGDLVREMSKP